jgi:hypothetical protein
MPDSRFRLGPSAQPILAYEFDQRPVATTVDARPLESPPDRRMPTATTSAPILK